MFSFETDQRKDSVFEGLLQSKGALTMADIVGMLDMCQIATCHERGERYVRQLGHYVAQGGVLQVTDASIGEVLVVDDLEKFRKVILRWDGVLDIATVPHLRPARE